MHGSYAEHIIAVDGTGCSSVCPSDTRQCWVETMMFSLPDGQELGLLDQILYGRLQGKTPCHKTGVLKKWRKNVTVSRWQ